MKPSITYPIRLNRYLYLTDVCSRRQADRLIADGKVFVNNKVAVIGQKINKGDKVTTDKSVREMMRTYAYYIYNKPRGIVSHNPQKGEKSIEDVSGLGKEVYPVGRLDKDSEGLILLTNDGRIVNKLLNPAFGHEREYFVRVDKTIKERDIKKLRKGVNIEGYLTKPTKVRRAGERSFYITLTEGKKHQIRRMTTALGYQVKDLKRIRMMHIKLDKLKTGDYRPLTKTEQHKLLKQLAIKNPKDAH